MYSFTNPASSQTISDFSDAEFYASPMSLSERIFKARSDAKMTQEELAKAVGKSRGAVAQWESGEVSPRRTTLMDIARATKRSVLWLEHGWEDGPPREPVIGLEVVGEVSAGVWKEAQAHFEKHYEPVASHPDYPGVGQRLYKVKGDSINRVADSGEYLHTVEVHNGGIRPEHGDLVIACRMQHGLAEYTAKQMIWEDGRWLLRPLSDNPAWQDDIELAGDEDTEIKVTDIVIAKWSPIPRRSLIPRDNDPFRNPIRF